MSSVSSQPISPAHEIIQEMKAVAKDLNKYLGSYSPPLSAKNLPKVIEDLQTLQFLIGELEKASPQAAEKFKSQDPTMEFYRDFIDDGGTDKSPSTVINDFNSGNAAGGLLILDTIWYNSGEGAPGYYGLGSDLQNFINS